jgi:predicted nucleotidyltransferase
MHTVDQVPSKKPNVELAALRQAIEQAAAILKAAGAEKLHLFGSALEGPLHPHYDIDLTVAGPSPDRFYYAMGQTLFILPRPLDLVDLDVGTLSTRYLPPRGDLGNDPGSLERLFDFRHVFRNAYSFQVEWDKMRDLVVGSPATWQQLQAELDRFFAYLWPVSPTTSIGVH